MTLITGDRVVLSGPDGKDVGIVPGKDRRHVTFRSYRKAGKLTVMPSDAERFVASGRLDPRLFDITGLVDGGFDDRRSRSLPLIVAYDGAAGRASVRKSGGTTVRELPSINGTAIRVAKGTQYLKALPNSGARFGGGVERIWLDGKRRLVLDQSVPQIGAPAAWQAGYTGTGVTVAVLDTGVDVSHPDLADRVAEAKNFTDQPAGDVVGHGTHVASTIAGTAAASDGRYKGVAPDARILDGKVCGDLFCPDSAILAGMQWAAVEKNADVVNLSIGAGNGPEIDPLEEAVNTLTAQTGTLFVIAAGNSGPEAGTVGSPGSAEAALTVGAVDKSDQLAPFSSRGPRTGDAGVKPDVTAPGVDIVAARSEASIIGEPVGDRYLRASGTSMATPHVAGAAALLAQQHPDWTATELKAALMSSAKPHAEQSAFEQGTGRVDVAKAITQSVLAVPGSLSFGTSRWPHSDDEPVRRQLTFRNTGATAVDLTLDASFTGPDGEPAPDGALTLSADTVSVPAGGTAAVAVTSDTRHGGPEGVYAGQVRATGAATGAITVPLSAELEPERYDVTVRHLDPDGAPSERASTWITGIDNDVLAIAVAGPDGAAKVRLPKGRYFIEGGISTDRGSERYGHYTILQPILQVDNDTAITIDARTAKPVRTTIPRSDAGLHYYNQTATVTAGPEPVGFHLITFADTDIFTASLGEPVPANQFTAGLNSVWGVTSPGGFLRDSPYSYHLMNTTQGAYWDGFTRQVRDSELAKLTAQHHGQEGGRNVLKVLYGYTDDGTTMIGGSQSYTRPARVVHYVEARGANWRTAFEEVEPDDIFWTTLLASPYRSYRAGQSYSERWNAAVFGPSLVAVFPGDKYAARTGNAIRIGIPTYSDSDHPGSSVTDSGSAQLYRDGELIVDSPTAYINADDVPGEPADFALVSTQTRPSVSNLSTRTDLKWTFRSQTTSSDESLPLWAVRYAPAVDERNTMERRPVTAVPLRLEAAPGSPVGSVTKVDVQVSGDDGSTWRKATVRRTGDNRYVAVFATPAGGYVSLKAMSADSRGNTTEQVIVRGFQLK